MKVKSFGCSFIFGTDLPDDGRVLPYATGSRMTWPALVAQHFGYEYETYARPGSGNLQILERLLNRIDPEDPAIYVVGWTYIDRFDYVDDSLRTPWGGTKWRTLMPIDDTSIANTYFRDLSTEYADKLRSLVYIRTAIDALQEKKCKFIMTYADATILCRKWHTTAASASLLDHCEPYLQNFENSTFVEWSQRKKFPISDANHPLIEAHRAAADHVLAHWNL